MIFYMEQGLNYFTFQILNYKGADQAAQMHRLVSPFDVCMQQSQVFACPSPFKIGKFKLKLCAQLALYTLVISQLKRYRYS